MSLTVEREEKGELRERNASTENPQRNTEKAHRSQKDQQKVSTNPRAKTSPGDGPLPARGRVKRKREQTRENAEGQRARGRE